MTFLKVAVCSESSLFEHRTTKRSLTVAAVLPSVSDGTVARESLPAHPAGSSVLTRVGLTERELGAAA